MPLMLPSIGWVWAREYGC